MTTWTNNYYKKLSMKHLQALAVRIQAGYFPRQAQMMKLLKRLLDARRQAGKQAQRERLKGKTTIGQRPPNPSSESEL